MDNFRIYYCNCTGKQVQMVYEATFGEEPDEVSEPHCPKCGATPSSDPKHVVSFHDQERFSQQP